MNPPWLGPAVVEHVALLLDSHRAALGCELVTRYDPAADAAALFAAPFAVVSHGTEADPMLNYANALALELWQTNWATLTRLPSRLTAEPLARAARAAMLAQAARDGCLRDYAGVRIGVRGRRFRISGATIWNLRHPDGRPAGQAATFDQWQLLTEPA